MLLLSTIVSEKLVEYDHMLQACNHLSGRDLQLKKLEMEELSREIAELQKSVSLKVYEHVK